MKRGVGAGNPLAVASSTLETAIDLRHLPQMEWGSLYSLYTHWTKEDEEHRAKRSCFDGVYNAKWARVLKIRTDGDCRRCHTCATLTKLAKEHPDAEKREQAAAAYLVLNSSLINLFIVL